MRDTRRALVRARYFGTVANRAASTPCSQEPPHGRSCEAMPELRRPATCECRGGRLPQVRDAPSDTRGPAAGGTCDSPEPRGESEATRRTHGGAGPGAASTRAETAGNRTSASGDPARTADDRGSAPTSLAAPPSATSATTRFRKNWAAAAWASSTRPDRSSSIAPSPSR